MDLRPLSLGEQLDRAVTLCVRSVLLFSLVYLAFSVPMTIFQIYGSEDPSKIMGGVVDLLRSHKPLTADAWSSVFRQAPVFNGFTVAFFGFLLFVSPLAQATLICAVSRVYLGSQVTFGSAYREGVRFWLPMIGINILYAVVGVGLYIIGILVGIAGVFAVGLLTSVSHGLGIFFGVAGGGILLILVIVIALLFWIALYLSYFACITERIGFLSAFARGVERAFSPTNFVRSLVAGLALSAIYIGIILVSLAGAAMIYGLLRSNAVGAAFTAVIEAARAVFFTVFFAVFYYDMRVRREGFDLRQEIAQTPPAAQ